MKGTYDYSRGEQEEHIIKKELAHYRGLTKDS